MAKILDLTLSPLRYLKMMLKMVGYDLKKQFKTLSSISSVSKKWKSHWEKVKEDDEEIFWSSPAFVREVPSLAKFTEGWLIISNKGLYFYCKRRELPKHYFRRLSKIEWQFNSKGLKAICNFIFDTKEDWSFYIPKREELFRARLFKSEIKEKDGL